MRRTNLRPQVIAVQVMRSTPPQLGSAVCVHTGSLPSRRGP